MTREELDNIIVGLDDELKTAKSRVYRFFAMSNNTVKIGDFIESDKKGWVYGV